MRSIATVKHGCPLNALSLQHFNCLQLNALLLRTWLPLNALLQYFTTVYYAVLYLLSHPVLQYRHRNHLFGSSCRIKSWRTVLCDCRGLAGPPVSGPSPSVVTVTVEESNGVVPVLSGKSEMG
jgi:hypothetical protein